MGGQKINDHSSWVGKGSKGTVFPEGVKLKGYSSAEGDGALDTYEDTSEAIKKQQLMGVAKMRGNAPKPGMRN